MRTNTPMCSPRCKMNELCPEGGAEWFSERTSDEGAIHCAPTGDVLPIHIDTNHKSNTIASMVAKISTGTISALYWKMPLYIPGSELSRLSAKVGSANTSTHGASRGKYPAGANSVLR